MAAELPRGICGGSLWRFVRKERDFPEVCFAKKALLGDSIPGVNRIVTAKRLVAFTALFMLAYVLWVGPMRFSIEAYGTWLMSPLIYARLLPTPASHWLLVNLLHHPLLADFLILVPVLMFAAAFLMAAYSFWRNSLWVAYGSFLIVATVISTYHYLQPMGMSLVLVP